MSDSNWVEMEIAEERTYRSDYGERELVTVGPGLVRVPLRDALIWGWRPAPEPDQPVEEAPPVS